MILYKELAFNDLLPSKDMPVIDCGCGDGRVSKAFYDEGYSVICIDIDQEKLDLAKKEMPKATFICGDIGNVDIPNGFIIFNNVLQFLDTKEQVYSLIKKHLADPMYISIFGPEDEKKDTALTWTREEVDALMKDIGHVVRFTEFKGFGRGLLKQKRYTHAFTILRIL